MPYRQSIATASTSKLDKSLMVIVYTLVFREFFRRIGCVTCRKYLKAITVTSVRCEAFSAFAAAASRPFRTSSTLLPTATVL
jgi:hypothetical protein